MITFFKAEKDIIKSLQNNQALLIDFDNTLMDYPVNEKRALLKLFSEIKLPETLHSQALNDYTSFNDYYWQQFDLKKIAIEKARHGGFEDLITKYNLPFDAKTLNDHFLECLVQTTSIDTAIIQSLKKLKESGSWLVIITNGVHATQSQRLENAGLLLIIDNYFTSESIGYPKPHPKMFLDSRDYLRSINCPTDEIWVIGDGLESDIKGGFDVGFNTCWITHDKDEKVIELEHDYPTMIVNSFVEFCNFYLDIKNKI